MSKFSNNRANQAHESSSFKLTASLLVFLPYFEHFFFIFFGPEQLLSLLARLLACLLDMPRFNSVSDSDNPVLRRLDYILLPFLCIFFSLSQLDVAVLGNAAAISRDSPTTSADSPWTDLCSAAKWFFISAAVLQPFGAALAWRVGASRWLSGVLILWGICALLHLKARGTQLVLLRIGFGALEGRLRFDYILHQSRHAYN